MKVFINGVSQLPRHISRKTLAEEFDNDLYDHRVADSVFREQRCHLCHEDSLVECSLPVRMA